MAMRGDGEEATGVSRPPAGMHSERTPSADFLSDNELSMQSNTAASPMSPYYDPGRLSGEGSPLMMSPWNQTANSRFSKELCSQGGESTAQSALLGSLVREEGHIYSLAATGNLLYTGSESKNIRVWKNLQEFCGFKSNSGLVKAIIISGHKIFTGHQDGKIRVWKVNPKAPNVHKRAGTLPTLKDILKSSLKPSNYIEVRKNRSALWIKHSDAVSALSLSHCKTLLYSASWDRSIKVWRISDKRCMESIPAHQDTVNSVVCGVDGLVFSGSADGTVKMWKRETPSSRSTKCTKHTNAQTLLKQESAVTALTLDASFSTLYCGSSDGLVNFWDSNNNFAHGGVLKGHKLAVLCLAAAGTLVFSGSADKTICVWKKEGTIHTCVSMLTGHEGPVKCLAVEEDKEAKARGGERRWVLYSGSLDKSVKVWSVADVGGGDNQEQQRHHRMFSDSDSIPFAESVSSYSSSCRSNNRK
ncbi:hypothetical protein HN51_042446 [Arachis hypogaea]|uniref:Protein JINGUBANG-like n=2 Tax=Arachis TaxID=3817 RepID=A0A6P4DR91_ARADU|nr:protein JINGUBANG-like [Arachis duranensis]XP_025607063.1 protein JINGUBANG-like [Arachis hypogaea]XP_025660461.1 protein JINGUBANG-like [Arachis hypogaea]